MADLDALRLFAKVVESGSFSEAARRLGMPLSTVSRRIAELEDQLNVRLLERSTRSVRLSEVGSRLLEHAQRTVELSETVDTIVSDRRSDISGLLRLSAPPSVSDSLVAPIVTAFQSAHPGIRIQVHVTERLVDHIAEGVDVVFRLGPLKDSRLVARRILSYRHRLTASPAYLKRHAPPRRPQDLHAHRLLAFAHWKPENRWTFRSANGAASETIVFAPSITMNDYAGLAAALLAEAGIGDLPPICAPELIRQGKLVEVMPDWHFRVYDLSVVHVGTRHISRSVRLFVDFAVAEAPQLFPDLPH